jgi:hypothetical protein
MIRQLAVRGGFMRKLILLASVGVFGAGGLTTAFACNCHLGRGVRFDRTSRAKLPASVLIYVSQNAGRSTLGSKELQSVLKQAGHKFEIVNDASILDQDVRSGKFDLVLAEYPDAIAFVDRVTVASSNAVVIPVMPKAQKMLYPEASKQFAYVVKSMGDSSEYLTRIDQAMKSRSGARGDVLKSLASTATVKYTAKQ